MTEEWMYNDGKRLNGIFDDVYWDFVDKFNASIGTSCPSCEFAYSDNGDVGYRLPAKLTDKQIREAIEKSVKDGHNYLHDLIAKPENESPELEPGMIY